MPDQWFHKIFQVDDASFEQVALEIFRFQYQHNPIYKAYADLLKVNPGKVNALSQVPFLPLQFFKTHQVKTTDFDTPTIFESSGTTQTVNSHHFVKDIELYKQSFFGAFELFYGYVGEWCILGLLPSYLERKNSSLVFMVDELVRRSQHPQSGFYLYDYERLYLALKELEEKKQKTLLIGVTYALLDFAERYSPELKNTIVMETGGMKGRKKEMVRSEVHDTLKRKFHVKVIHSEYGMTELLSQAYSQGSGIFRCPPWMKILVRNEEDPLEVHLAGPDLRGVINITDLANIYSCSFLATDDAGILHGDGSFEVLGRIDNSDIRGCSLMTL